MLKGGKIKNFEYQVKIRRCKIQCDNSEEKNKRKKNWKQINIFKKLSHSQMRRTVRVCTETRWAVSSIFFRCFWCMIIFCLCYILFVQFVLPLCAFCPLFHFDLIQCVHSLSSWISQALTRALMYTHTQKIGRVLPFLIFEAAKKNTEHWIS